MGTGFSYDLATGETTEFVVPPPTLEERQEAMLAQLADIRYQHETGGITVAGVPIATDRESQAIVDRIVKAYDDGDITGDVDFKSPAGWVSIGEATIRAIKAAGAQHVQASFSYERALATAIAAATDHSDLDEIDLEYGWS